MIFLYFPEPSPTSLTWEEKNSGDYTYVAKDFKKMDEFFSEFEKGKWRVKL